MSWYYLSFKRKCKSLSISKQYLVQYLFQSYSLLISLKTLEAILSYFASNLHFIEKFNAVEALNVLANIINISFKENEILIENLLEWSHVINTFFLRIQSLTSKSSKKQHWHPILGWISEGINLCNEHSNNAVRQQLTYFWSKKMVKCLFGKVLGSVEGSTTLYQTAQEVEKLSKDLIQSRLFKNNR